MSLESFDTRGYWFLPSNRDNVVFGTLSYDPGQGTYLHLEPGLIDVDETKLYGEQTICGETTDGTLITLDDWYLKEGSSAGCVVFANTCYLGKQYTDREQITFREVRLQYSNLDEWVWTHGFQLPKSMPSNISIHYELPNPVTLYESEEICASIHFAVVPPSWSIVQKHVTIRQKVYLRLQYNTDRYLSDIDGDLFKLQSFISFGIGHPIIPTSMAGVAQDAGNPKNYVDILYIPHVPRRQVIVPPQRMLFTLRALGANVRDFVAKWFSNPELEPITQLYTAMQITGEYLYEEPKLVSYAQALESYHRRFMNRTELPKHEHKAMKRAIITAVEEKYRDWLRDKLAWSNEISLKKRLDDLVLKFHGILDFPEDFTKRVTDTRNYYVHYNQRLEDKVYQGVEVLNANTELLKLLTAALLSEIGFENNQIREMIVRAL